MNAATTPQISGVQSADFEFRALEEAENYRNALIQTFREHLRGRVLEVGAGVGQLTTLLLQLPSIRQLVSLEPDSRFCQRLRAKLPGHNVIQGTVDDLPQGEGLDAILSVNVLEHIRGDDRELSAYHTLLKPNNGVFCLFVPARPEIYAPLDRDFGHFRRYTKSELRRKLEHAGFRPLKLHYFNLIGYFAWWFSFCLLKKRRFDTGAVRCFDRLIFPPLFWLESRALHPPIGQSLIAIARAS